MKDFLRLTFECFLWQVLKPKTSCREVVRQVQALFRSRAAAATLRRGTRPISKPLRPLRRPRVGAVARGVGSPGNRCHAPESAFYCLNRSSGPLVSCHSSLGNCYSARMARKASANSESSRGFYDIIGVVLMCFAALLFAALLSYHPRDVSANAVPPNSSVHNWIGPFGAWLAYGCFLPIGAAAFVLPVLLFFVGLGASSTRSATCAAAGSGRWSF